MNANLYETQNTSQQQERDIYEEIFARTTALLTHPRILGFIRTSCRLLYTLVAICIAFIILASLQQFTVRTLSTLYVVITIALLLHAIFNSYYILLLFHHYPRIRYYLYRHRTHIGLHLFGARILQVVFTLIFMVFMLTVEVVTIPQ